LKLKQGFASNDLLISDYERRKRTIFIAKVVDRTRTSPLLLQLPSHAGFLRLALHSQDKIRDLQERYRALSAQVHPAGIP